MIYKVIAIMLILALTMGLTFTGVVAYVEETLGGLQTVVEAINPQKSDTLSASLSSTPLYDDEGDSVGSVLKSIILTTTPYEGLVMDGDITSVDSKLYSVKSLVFPDWYAVHFVYGGKAYYYLIGDEYVDVGYYMGAKGKTALITESYVWTVICRYDFAGKPNINPLNIVSGVRIVREDIDTVTYLREYLSGSRGDK